MVSNMVLKHCIRYSFVLFICLIFPLHSCAAPIPQNIIKQFLVTNNANELKQAMKAFKPYLSENDYYSMQFSTYSRNYYHITPIQYLIQQKTSIAISSLTLRQALLPKLIAYYKKKHELARVVSTITNTLGNVPLQKKVWYFPPTLKKQLLPIVKQHIPACTKTTNMKQQLNYFNTIRTIAFLDTSSYKSIGRYMAHYLLHETNPFCQNIIITYGAKPNSFLLNEQIEVIAVNLSRGMKDAQTKKEKEILGSAKTQLLWGY